MISLGRKKVNVTKSLSPLFLVSVLLDYVLAPPTSAFSCPFLGCWCRRRRRRCCCILFRSWRLLHSEKATNNCREFCVLFSRDFSTPVGGVELIGSCALAEICEVSSFVLQPRLIKLKEFDPPSPPPFQTGCSNNIGVVWVEQVRDQALSASN